MSCLSVRSRSCPSSTSCSAFLSPRTKQAEPKTTDAADPKARLAELRGMVDAQEEAAKMLRAKLEEFEKVLYAEQSILK
jgi:hypothetical protein